MDTRGLSATSAVQTNTSPCSGLLLRYRIRDTEKAWSFLSSSREDLARHWNYTPTLPPFKEPFILAEPLLCVLWTAPHSVLTVTSVNLAWSYPAINLAQV